VAVRDIPHVVSQRIHDSDAFALKRYLEDGGYEALRHATNDLSPVDVHNEVKSSGLTGRSGGAAFPTASKWELLRKDSAGYLIINADESEPGFFKDRRIMERDPHLMIEGTLLSAYALEVRTVFVYIRGEFALALERVQTAINEAYEYGAIGSNIFGSDFSCNVIVHPGAGAYICGEETALIESLEGKRGFPRIKPPFFPAVNGLYNQPTIVNNVETVATVPWIISNGGASYATWGGGRFTGTRLYCLSGRIRQPGIYEVEQHVPTFRDLLFDASLGGGMIENETLKAFIPGASFPWFFPEQLELHLDGDEVSANGSSLGAGVMVLDSSTCPVRVAWRLVRFFSRESCGQCTPCREGSGWLEHVLHRIEYGGGRPEDLELLLDLGDNISPGPFPHPPRPERGEGAVAFPYTQTTICPLGPSAVSPVDSSIYRFRDDYLVHINEGFCPYGHNSTSRELVTV